MTYINIIWRENMNSRTRRRRRRANKSLPILTSLRRIKTKFTPVKPYKPFSMKTLSTSGKMLTSTNTPPSKNARNLHEHSLQQKARRLHKCIKKPNSRKAGLVAKRGSGSGRAWKPWCAA
ncbi:MAG: hypothetical protein [Cressdnaviricota sp.]|nr:MAG: hypothetical protein [Cressdnaviricota sp.]